MKMTLILLLTMLSTFISAQTIFKPTTLMIGKGTDVDMAYVVDRLGTDDPKLKWDGATFKWYFSNDGLTFGEMVDKVYVDAAVAGATIPDASISVKGKIQLAGDLAGTAALPTVPGLILKAPLASPALTGVPTAPTAAALDNSTQIATTAYVDTAVTGATVPDATTSSKGKIQLAGDLAGTAALPTVPGLATKEPLITATTSADYYRGDKTFQPLNKTAVGLPNVDNTSDLAKPISTATQTALDARISKVTSTDNAIVRFDGLTGAVQDSLATIDDSGNVSATSFSAPSTSTTSSFSGVQINNTAVGSTGTDNLTLRAGGSGTGTLIMQGDLNPNRSLVYTIGADSTTTGANATVAAFVTKYVRFTNASLTSIDMIPAPAGTGAKEISFLNNTGNQIVLNYESGATAGNRINGASGPSYKLKNTMAVNLVYNATTARWIVQTPASEGGYQSGSTELLVDPSFENFTNSDYTSLTGGTTALSGGAPILISPTNQKMLAITVSGAGSVTFSKTTGTSFVGSAMRVGGWFYSTQAGDTVNENINGTLTGNSCSLILNSWTPCFFEASTPTTSYGYVVTWLTGAHQVYLDLNTIAVDRKTSALVNLWGSQSTFLAQAATIGAGSVVTGALTTSTGTGIFSYNSATGVYTVLRDAIVNISATLGIGATQVQATILVNGSSVADDFAATNGNANAAWEGKLITGNTFTINNTSGAGNSNGQKITVTAQAQSPNIITTNDTFSTDTANIVYAGSSSYNLSTLANAPVGTFITFTYAINGNAQSQTNAAPPSQTPASVNSSGMQITNRAYNAASNSNDVAAWAMQIGKNLKGVTLNLYKSLGKTTTGSLDWTVIGTNQTEGARYKNYNEATGILYVDAGFNPLTTIVAGQFVFSDLTSQGFGYVTVNASKNPAMTGIDVGVVSARAVSSGGQSIPNAIDTVVTWDTTKSFDTTGSLNTTTGVFTCPVSGYYLVNASTEYASSAWTAGGAAYITILKNGLTSGGGYIEAQATRSMTLVPTVNTGIYLAKGDTLTVSAYQTRGSATALTTGSLARSFFSIMKVSIGNQ